jgi:hypothetical protein
VVSVLKPGPDPAAPWSIEEIDRIPTSHRLRTADIDGSGRKVVVNAALTGSRAEPPDFRDNTPLVYYVPGEWKRREIQPQNLGLVHGIYVVDWNGNQRDGILTAGFEGIHLFQRTPQGAWTRTEIAKGDPSPWPKSGSSDVALGRLGRERFLAAIEPWHGNQVVTYRLQGKAWTRHVLDDSITDGHTIQVIDVNGSGSDSMVVGYRGGAHNLKLYGADGARQVIDEGGMAAASCAVADLNADGRPDIACIGTATANLKWYENSASIPAR